MKLIVHTTLCQPVIPKKLVVRKAPRSFVASDCALRHDRSFVHGFMRSFFESSIFVASARVVAKRRNGDEKVLTRQKTSRPTTRVDLWSLRSLRFMSWRVREEMATRPVRTAAGTFRRESSETKKTALDNLTVITRGLLF
jgi:hypothetical protein